MLEPLSWQTKTTFSIAWLRLAAHESHGYQVDPGRIETQSLTGSQTTILGFSIIYGKRKPFNIQETSKVYFRTFITGPYPYPMDIICGKKHSLISIQIIMKCIVWETKKE